MWGLYSHWCEYRKICLRNYFWNMYSHFGPCPLYWYSACICTSLVPIHKNIFGELFSVQIHAAHVFTSGRIQENIPGELFMYWFRARGYSPSICFAECWLFCYSFLTFGIFTNKLGPSLLCFQGCACVYFGRFGREGAWGAPPHLTFPSVVDFFFACLSWNSLGWQGVQKGPPHSTPPVVLVFLISSFWTVVEVRWPFPWFLGHLTSPNTQWFASRCLIGWVLVCFSCFPCSQTISKKLVFPRKTGMKTAQTVQ